MQPGYHTNYIIEGSPLCSVTNNNQDCQLESGITVSVVVKEVYHHTSVEEAIIGS